MADILKVSMPLVEKVPIQPNKPIADPAVPFQLSELTKVIQTDAQNPMQQQGNTLANKDDAPSILMDMLKDPSVTVSFLKNMFMLEEIINLIPVHNTSLTQELEQLYTRLLISPEQIVQELERQESSATSFRGELFDQLRTLIKEMPTPEMKFAVINLLKSLNGSKSQETILNSVANNLEFVAKNVKVNHPLSEKLELLARALRTPNAPISFTGLKNEILAALKEVESSILFSPKLQKIVPLIIYNLSRFQDNPDYLKEASGALISVLSSDDKRELLSKLINREINLSKFAPVDQSKVMDVISKIIEKGVSDKQLASLVGDKFEKIIHSLLSSPCNYTPLLHFVLPVDTGDIKAFSEMWVDPFNEEEEDNKSKSGSKAQDSIHLLAVFDVENIGRIEAEIITSGKNLQLALYCPEIFVSAFSQIGSKIAPMVAASGYSLKEARVEKMARQRSLMEVFKNLPKKRTGIDVRV